MRSSSHSAKVGANASKCSDLWVGNLSKSRSGRSGTEAAANVEGPVQQAAGRIAANCLLEKHWRHSAVAGIRTGRSEKSVVVVDVASE